MQVLIVNSLKGYFQSSLANPNRGPARWLRCLAAIEILGQSLPKSGKTVLTNLLENARKPTWRIWAENSPFETKDILKARGYRWNPEAGKQPRGRYIKVAEAARESEEHFLKSEIYCRELSLKSVPLNAYNRYSDRIAE
jgi:DNA polymerase-3 subunit epsilon